MSREDRNKATLYFDTQKDIAKRQEESLPALTTSLKRGTEKIVTKVKDFFHTNEEFYRFDQQKQAIHKSDVSISPTSKEPSSSLSSAPSLSPSSSSSFSTDLPSSPTSASEKGTRASLRR
jgi:hypothetical protein